MTFYEFMARWGSDDVSVVISCYDREYDDDIRTTAYAIQANEPYCEDDYEINNAQVVEWYFDKMMTKEEYESEYGKDR